MLLVALVAVVGFAMALSLHHDCTHAPSEVDAPVPGTPRARYCGAVHADQLWLLPLLTAALAGAVAVAGRRRSVLVVWTCVLIAVASAVVAGHAGGLAYNTSL